MPAPKKATHVVLHPKQYLAVAGKLQHIPVGTELTMDEKAASGLVTRGRLGKLGGKKTVDLTPDKEEG